MPYAECMFIAPRWHHTPVCGLDWEGILEPGHLKPRWKRGHEKKLFIHSCFCSIVPSSSQGKFVMPVELPRIKGGLRCLPRSWWESELKWVQSVIHKTKKNPFLSIFPHSLSHSHSLDDIISENFHHSPQTSSTKYNTLVVHLEATALTTFYHFFGSSLTREAFEYQSPWGILGGKLVGWVCGVIIGWWRERKRSPNTKWFKGAEVRATLY